MRATSLLLVGVLLLQAVLPSIQTDGTSSYHTITYDYDPSEEWPEEQDDSLHLRGTPVSPPVSPSEVRTLTDPDTPCAERVQSCYDCLGGSMESKCMWKAAIDGSEPRCVDYVAPDFDDVNDLAREWIPCNNDHAKSGKSAPVSKYSILRPQVDYCDDSALKSTDAMCSYFQRNLFHAASKEMLKDDEGDDDFDSAGIDCSERERAMQNKGLKDDLWFRCADRTHEEYVRNIDLTVMDIPRGMYFWHGTKRKLDKENPVVFPPEDTVRWLGSEENGSQYGKHWLKFTPKKTLRLLELNNINTVKMIVDMLYTENPKVKEYMDSMPRGLGQSTHEDRLHNGAMYIISHTRANKMNWMQQAMHMMSKAGKLNTWESFWDYFGGKINEISPDDRKGLTLLDRNSQFDPDEVVAGFLCEGLKTHPELKIDGYANPTILFNKGSIEEWDDWKDSLYSEIMVCDVHEALEGMHLDAEVNDVKEADMFIPGNDELGEKSNTNHVASSESDRSESDRIESDRTRSPVDGGDSPSITRTDESRIGEVPDKSETTKSDAVLSGDSLENLPRDVEDSLAVGQTK